MSGARLLHNRHHCLLCGFAVEATTSGQGRAYASAHTLYRAHARTQRHDGWRFIPMICSKHCEGRERPNKKD
jgi:hypothetical protein